MIAHSGDQTSERPYEQIAFQFSHHTLQQDGSIAHKDQFIHLERGSFPNFHFLRALKISLQSDSGTIFMYAPHENTVLCQIFDQLSESTEPDREELQTFIRTITNSKEDSSRGEWSGPRSMVDMCDLVKKYFYHPLTGGSNSIKKVLPAVLSESKLLKTKYSKPIYGNEIKSNNFSNQVWLQLDQSGAVIDPYKQLPPVFDGISEEKLNNFLFDGDDLRDGGSALMAFAKMQFTQMTDEERSRIRAALLRYCELDTLAMVMIYEYWMDATGIGRAKLAA